MPLRHLGRLGGIVGVLLTILASSPASAETDADSLRALLNHMDAFLRREESEGVTVDSRRLRDPPEQIRLSVVPQLLGYCELLLTSSRKDHLEDVKQRADFLVAGMDAFRAGDAADGMLGYALLCAFETTGQARYQEAARPIVETCLGLDLSKLRLNRGLMAAMVLAKHHQLTKDVAALDKAMAIVGLAAREQHADGSFPHFCPASRDVHYTAWMGMELHLLGKLLVDPTIPRTLDRIHAFLQGRVGLDGITRYEETVAPFYYYSLPLCPGDYDTRGWTNELGYLALLFDRYQDPRLHAMIARLLELEDRGAFADKCAYTPAPEDPFFAWAGASRSVIRTSLVFWSLACIYAQRLGQRPDDAIAFETQEAVVPGAAAHRGGGQATSEAAAHAPAALGLLAPNPARGGVWVPFRLGVGASIRLTIHDPAGRRVRKLLEGQVSRGAERVRWDGQDEGNRPAPPGMYFVRLEVDGKLVGTARLVLVR